MFFSGCFWFLAWHLPAPFLSWLFSSDEYNEQWSEGRLINFS